MNNIKKIVSVLFSAILLFSATTTSSIAIDKIHFVIGGGAGGGWDRTLTASILGVTIFIVGWQIYKTLKNKKI